MKKILVLSGKGGTGKTTIASHFIKISNSRVFADTDVEAPNLHLMSLAGKLKRKEAYNGLNKYRIIEDLCISCGKCRDSCRFNAISFNEGKYKINKYLCEGCSVCQFVCPAKAIESYQSVDGEISLYKDEKLFSTAQLKMGSGNSGLLVTKVKKTIEPEILEDDLVIIDGPPGIGCPVIASMSGVDLVLLVSEPSVSGISDLIRIIKTASSFHLKIAVCINKYDLNKSFSQKIIKYCSDNGYDFVGKIRYDSEIIESINQGRILSEKAKAYKDIISVYDKTISLLD
jgi:MinD superfamily P-loop ATPase